MSKHYDANYLEETEKLLIGLKQASYAFLDNINQGQVLEVGCGTGSDALQIARIKAEGVQVTGLDHDEQLLALGRAAASEAGLKNITFVEGSAENLPFEDNTFDGIRAERLIQHLPQPKKVIDEMHRVLKPGGQLVLVETDWSGLQVYVPELEIERKYVNYLVEERVNFGTASREIGLLLKYQGFNNIQLDVKPFVIDRLEAANKYIMFDKMLMSAVEAGYLSTNESNHFLQVCQELDEAGMFACCMSMLTYQAEK